MKLEEYKTLRKPSEYELKEKKSIFLAKTYPVHDEAEVENILAELKKKYYDAAHRCYAFRLVTGGVKYSDAGEPHGTAGIRILNAIDHFDLKDCLVVVIRYFGGIKLGVGPLGKAYYNSAKQALSISEIISLQQFMKVEFNLEFSSLDKLFKVLNANNIQMEEPIYDNEAKIMCFIPVNLQDNIIKEIKNILSGKVKISIKDGAFFR